MNLNSEIKGSSINGEEFLLFLKADVGVQGQWKSGQLCFVHFSDEHTDNGQNPDNKQTPVRRRLIICILYVPSYSDMIWIFYHIRRIQNWNALHELFSFVFLDFLYKILKNVINLENWNAGKFSGWVFPFSKGTMIKNSESVPEWQNIWTELTLDFGILFITG